MRFEDREHAGRLLAARLEGLRPEHPVVVGLTSGGIPVAFEVARRLEVPLEMVVVRKLRAPGRPEETVGAVAEGGETYLNPVVLHEAGFAEEDAARLAEDEVGELSRRIRLFRGGRPLPHVAGRTVVVVDDGVGTGASARAACRALRRRGARRVVLAVPVVASGTRAELRRDCDEVVAVEVTEAPGPIAGSYVRSGAVTDDDVLGYLHRADAELGASAAARLPPGLP